MSNKKETYLISLKNMDNDAWKLLREQKQELVTLVESGAASDKINGLIHLLDAIQDEIVNIYGVPADVIFGKD